MKGTGICGFFFAGFFDRRNKFTATAAVKMQKAKSSSSISLLMEFEPSFTRRRSECRKE